MEQTETQKPRRGDGRIAFLAQREEIQNRVNQGLSLIAIYELLQGKLGGITYSTFARHAKKFIIPPEKLYTASPQPQQSPLTPPEPQTALKAEEEQPPQALAGSAQSGFKKPNPVTENQWI